MAEIGIVRERFGDVENDVNYLFGLATEGHILYCGPMNENGVIVHYFMPYWDVE